MHTAGWPLNDENTGGSFLYHLENNQVVVGLIVDLSYSNPHLSPFDEFQRYKHHPVIKQYLEGGKRVSYGARAIAKGGLNCLPKMVFNGGALIGCDAGTLNFAKIKGSHTAMKSGMLAAEAAADALLAGREGGDELSAYEEGFKNSWLYDELYKSRNFGAAIHKWGAIKGGAFNFIDQNIFGGKIPFTLHDTKPDYACLKPAAESKKIEYPKPDGKLSFDKLSSVFLSNTNHEEDQPVHLKLTDPSIPIDKNLPLYDEPAQRYCPAGVYEVVSNDDGSKRFQINAQNCVHCKTCDIRTRPRTSPGSRRKVPVGRTTPTCKQRKGSLGSLFMPLKPVYRDATRYVLWEKHTAAPHAEPALAVHITRHGQIHQLIEHVAMNQRLEIGAHANVRRWFLSLRVEADAQRMLLTGLHHIVNIGDETQQLRFALPAHVQPHRDEGRIFDLDTDLFHRRKQEVIIAIASNHCGEQTNHRRTPDGRALVKPGTVSCDTHVEVAAEWRVPQMHRRQPSSRPPRAGPAGLPPCLSRSSRSPRFAAMSASILPHPSA